MMGFPTAAIEAIQVDVDDIISHQHLKQVLVPCTAPGRAIPTGNAAYTLGAVTPVLGVSRNVDNAAAVDNGGGTVRIPVTGHEINIEVYGKYITIAGTVNYDGDYAVVAVPDANHLDITATYVAEVFTGGGVETVTGYVPVAFTVVGLSIESMSDVAVFQINLYADGGIGHIGSTTAVKSAVQGAYGASRFSSQAMPAKTKITATASDNAAGAHSVTIRLQISPEP